MIQESSFPLRRLVAGLPTVAVLAGIASAVYLGTGPAPSPAPSPLSSPPRSSPAYTATPSAGDPTPTPEPRRQIVIQVAGDVSLDPSYLPVFREEGYGWAWSGLDGMFLRDDLSIVNLECPVTTISEPIVKTFNFRCDPLALPAMREAGVEVANQANNHAFDQGPDGLVDSLVQIRAAGLVAVGAGVGAEATRPALLDIGGWRIAVVGIGEVLDPDRQVAGVDSPGTAAGHDFDAVIAEVEAASRVADLVIVVIHWGVELDTVPRAYQVDQARLMIAAGADMIFGHHAHRVQPLEYVDGRPVFYGLGNFVWPRLSTASATSAVARVTVRPDGTFEAELVPVEIVSNGHPVPR